MKKMIIALICVCAMILSLTPNVLAENISITEFESRVNSMRDYKNVSQIYNGYAWDGTANSACYKDLYGWASWQCMA